jgi:fluoride exporter
MKLILAIAAGGAIGAVGRHMVNVLALSWFGNAFPWGTLTVNFFGCFLMGVLVETSALVWSPSQALRAFIAVGFLGALTTFSSFSLDVAVLYERGQPLLAAIYVLASVTLSIVGIFSALALMRAVLQ